MHDLLVAPTMQRALTVQHRSTLLRDAVTLIEAEYATQLELDDVARRIATSRRQLQRCFNEHADESFRSCVTRIRMERAAELLVDTPYPVRQIARLVGYSQPAQFAKAFRGRYGVAPMEYRSARRGPERPPPPGDAAPRRVESPPRHTGTPGPSDFFALAV